KQQQPQTFQIHKRTRTHRHKHAHMCPDAHTPTHRHTHTHTQHTHTHKHTHTDTHRHVFHIFISDGMNPDASLISIKQPRLIYDVWWQEMGCVGWWVRVVVCVCVLSCASVG